MRKIVILFLLPAVLLLDACSEYKKGKGGLQYRIVEDKNTPAIGKLAVVFLSYTETTESGKVLSATGIFDPRPTEVYATMPKFEGDLQDAFPYLSEGDSAVVKVSMDSIKHNGYSALLASDTSRYMIYTLKFNKVINQDGKTDTTFLPRVEAYKRKELLRSKTAEPDKIKRYLAAEKLHYKATSSGLLYPSDLKLTDNTGKELYVRYTISSLDGKVYEASFKKITINGNIFKQVPFSGFIEAVSLIPKGVTTKIIIPSQLAYGSRGDNTDMPPYTPLLCEFEILNK